MFVSDNIATLRTGGVIGNLRKTFNCEGSLDILSLKNETLEMMSQHFSDSVRRVRGKYEPFIVKNHGNCCWKIYKKVIFRGENR
jgi:hypothetical protein